jgi:DNA-binding NarL/FixJ family response regulator
MIQLVIVDDEQLIASSMATLLNLEEDSDVLRTFPLGRRSWNGGANKSPSGRQCRMCW